MKVKSTLIATVFVGLASLLSVNAFALTDAQKQGINQTINSSNSISTVDLTRSLVDKYSTVTLDVVELVIKARPSQAALVVFAAIERSSLPVTEIVATAVNAAPDQAPQIVSAAILTTAITIDPDMASSIVTAAINAAPDQAEIIAQVALSAGLSSEQVTIAAIAGGADPTTVAQATAAGVPEAPTVQQQNSRVNRGSGVSPD